MKSSVAIVIVGDETNISLSWTTDFHPVLLTDELSVTNNLQQKCNNFDRVALGVANKGTSLMLLLSLCDMHYYST